MPVGFPVVVPNEHVARMLRRNARLLILGRRLSLGSREQLRLYEIHNALTVRNNTRHRKNGRQDLQENPHVWTIEPLTIKEVPLGGVDEKLARAAGFESVGDFQGDWRRRHRHLDMDRCVFVIRFEVIDVRYLHKDVHRGYTSDPGQGASQEPPALSDEELEVYARDARERDELVRGARRTAMPIEDRIRELSERARRGSRDAQRALFTIRQSVERAERKAGEAA